MYIYIYIEDACGEYRRPLFFSLAFSVSSFGSPWRKIEPESENH